MELGGDRMCFACGEENPRSLNLQFTLKGKNKEQVVATYTSDQYDQGYEGIMHGGLVSTLLDEAMAKVLSLNDIRAVTAEMTTRCKHPVEIGTELIITGYIKEKKSKLYFTEAELREKRTNRLMARGEAKFMTV